MDRHPRYFRSAQGNAVQQKTISSTHDSFGRSLDPHVLLHHLHYRPVETS